MENIQEIEPLVHTDPFEECKVCVIIHRHKPAILEIEEAIIDMYLHFSQYIEFYDCKPSTRATAEHIARNRSRIT